MEVMKIGFSLGRCVRDIVIGNVAIDDVAFLITATAVKDREQLMRVVEDYMYRPGYLDGLDEIACKEIATVLWNTNKLLQPRLQGLHRHMQPEESIWVDLFPTALSNNDSVKNAWNGYRFMLHMVENVNTDSLEVFK
jgi:hypothetical protein